MFHISIWGVEVLFGRLNPLKPPVSTGLNFGAPVTAWASQWGYGGRLIRLWKEKSNFGDLIVRNKKHQVFAVFSLAVHNLSSLWKKIVLDIRFLKQHAQLIACLTHLKNNKDVQRSVKYCLSPNQVCAANMAIA